MHNIIPSVIGDVNIRAMSYQESDHLHVPVQRSILQGIPILAPGLNAGIDPFLQCFLSLPPLLLCEIHQCFPVVARFKHVPAEVLDDATQALHSRKPEERVSEPSGPPSFRSVLNVRQVQLTGRVTQDLKH